jgi:signal peptide peptidase SppA
MLLPHLASRLYGTPLLLVRSKLDVILSVLGERVQWPAAQEALPIPAPRSSVGAAPGIAVIPVYGTLVRRSLGLDAASGLTSYGQVAAMLDAALADASVTGILLDIDSPGGEAGGVFELAQRVRAASAVKPVWAVASDSAFSAAYAIASAASRIYVSQTGGVGSIGVIAMHVDQTARDAQDGYRFTAVTAGAHKNDFSPHEPLDPDAYALLQAEVDRLYGLFVDHVATMRGLDAVAVRATEAGLYFGPNAISVGLADRLGTTESALVDFASYLATNAAASGPRFLAATSPALAPASKGALSSTNPMEKTAMHENAIDRLPPESSNAPDDPALVPEKPDPADGNAAAQPQDHSVGNDVSAAVNAAVTQVRADAVAIAELCQLAGQPGLTLSFLSEGASVAQVRKTLLAGRAQGAEISSLIHPDAAATAASPEQNPLMKAVKKLTGKD